MKLDKNKLIKIILLILIVFINKNIILILNKYYKSHNINIVFATSNTKKIVLQAYIMITSILQNANPKTKFTFYTFISEDLDPIYKKNINSFCVTNRKCKFIFYTITNEFSHYKSKVLKTKMAWTRLIHQDIFPEIDRALWFDTDVLVYKDLYEMYNYDMKDNYYMGFLDTSSKKGFAYNTKCDANLLICSGCILMNSKKLRKDKMSIKFKNFYMNNKITFGDQQIINCVCFGKLGRFPAIYGIFNLFDEDILMEYIRRTKTSDYHYTEKELRYALENKVVYHYVYSKYVANNMGLRNKKDYKCYKDCEYYAKLSGFYKDIEYYRKYKK